MDNQVFNILVLIRGFLLYRKWPINRLLCNLTCLLQVRARVVGALCKKEHTPAGSVKKQSRSRTNQIDDNVQKNNTLKAPAGK